jgi:hypothetical protein
LTAAFTTWVTTFDVDPLKFESPPYAAVIEFEPAGNPDVLYVATPEPFNVPLPNVMVPSKKLTKPVGMVVLPEGPVTVAVKVTDCPAAEGFEDETSAVVDEGAVPGMLAPCIYTGCGLPAALSENCSVPASSL